MAPAQPCPVGGGETGWVKVSGRLMPPGCLGSTGWRHHPAAGQLPQLEVLQCPRPGTHLGGDVAAGQRLIDRQIWLLPHLDEVGLVFAASDPPGVGASSKVSTVVL